MKIQVLNPVWAKVPDPKDAKALFPCLSYKDVYVRKGPGGFGKSVKEYRKGIISKEGLFPAGLVDRVVDWCGEHQISVEVERPVSTVPESIDPKLNGITFRKDQAGMIEAVRQWHTGYLKAPTRSGKTVVAAGIISAYPNAKALFLVNTITLLQQTVSEFQKFLNRSVGVLGGGESIPGDIMVSTMQSFWKKLEKDPETAALYDIIIVDECFAKGTLIQTLQGSIPIENICIGDHIYSQKGIDSVARIFKNKIPLEKITRVCIDGKYTFCSKDHLFYTDSEWVPAQWLTSNSKLNYWKPATKYWWLSHMLQIGYRKSTIENRSRSGWRWPSKSASTKIRQEKGRQAKLTGVESVEIYKQGHNDELFRSVIRDTEKAQGFVEFYDFEAEKNHSYYANGVLVHNCHHISAMDGTYAKILSLMPAPIRVGLTATPPKDGTEARLALEGFIGPQLEEISMEQGLASGILAIPKMKFIKLEPDRKVRELRRYEDVYTEGIVRNKNRNRLILSEARQQIREGKTVLIVVLRLEHADELVSMGSAMGVLPVIVNGATEGDAREQLRLAMNRKEVNCVICTAVWREGVNIPSLGCLINAAGGKAEIMTIQVLGRGLTRTEGKDEGILIDVLDNSHPYLSSHAIERLCIYSSQGWL